MSRSTTTGTIIDHLAADHEQIKSLFSDVMFLRPEDRGAVFDELVSGLVAHEVAEEIVVYPAIQREVPAAAAEIEARLHEQAEVEQMLDAMQALEPSGAEFSEALTELSMAVLVHAEAEEHAIFPRLRSFDDIDTLVDLADRYEKVKKTAPTSPHPGAPEPVAALFDRLRDAARRI